MADSSNCRCGSPISQARGLGLFRTINSIDSSRTADLLAKKLSNVVCDVGCVQQETISVLLVDEPSRTVFVALGSRAHDRETELEAESRTKPLNFELAWCHDHSDLYERFKEILRPRLAKALSLLNDRSRLAYEWRTIGPGEIAALSTVLTGDVPGLNLKIASSQHLSLQDASELVSDLQVLSWTMMAYDWVNEEDINSLEEDVAYYIDRCPVLPDAPRMYRDSITETESALTNYNPRARYCWLAILAAIVERDPDLALEREQLDALAFLWVDHQRTLHAATKANRAAVNTYSISAKRIKRLVPTDSLRFAVLEHYNNAIAKDGTQLFGDTYEELVALLASVGFDDPRSQIQESIIIGSTPEDAIAILDETIPTGDGPEWDSYILRIATRRILGMGDTEALDKVVHHFLSRIQDPHRANIRVWAAQQEIPMGALKNASRWLDGLTDDQFVDDESLANYYGVKAHLYSRQNRHTQVLNLLDDAPQRIIEIPWVKTNLTILRARSLKNTGDVITGLELLEDLACDESIWDPPLFETLASFMGRLGQYGKARQYSQRSLELSLQSRARWRPATYAAHVLYFDSLAGSPLDVYCIEELLAVSVADAPSGYAIATIATLRSQPDSESRAWKIVARSFDRMTDSIRVAIENSDGWLCTQWLIAALSAALLEHRTYGQSPEFGTWVTSYIEAFGNNIALSPYMLGLLISAGSTEFGYLIENLYILSHATVGNDSSSRLGTADEKSPDWLMEMIIDGLLELPDIKAEAVRTINESTRARALRSTAVIDNWTHGNSQDSTGRARVSNEGVWMPNDSSVLDLIAGSPIESLLVVEWLRGTGDQILITQITKTGLYCQVVEPPKIDLEALDRRLLYRLSNWHRSRQGDAFDVPDWKEARSWFRQLVTSRYVTGGQVVVMRSPRHSRLPWHHAVIDIAPISYETSWFGLRESLSREQVSSFYSEGVAIVPRIAEAPEVLTAMKYFESMCREVKGVKILSGRECTSSRFTEMLASTQLVTLVLHGVVGEDGVRLLLSDGRDVANPLADASGHATNPEFGWRQLLTLERAPEILLSAACGSSVSLEIGLGETNGIHNVMRTKGLQSFVGPLWDVDPRDVFPILLAIGARVRSGSVMGDAYRSAILDALNRGTPPWSVFALSLEGSWL